MTRHEYYQQMKALARELRQQYRLNSARVLRSDLRRIYRAEGITVDLWPHPLKKLRGAYFRDESGPSVMLAKHLPPEPLIFTMAHELKHHFVDRELQISYCDPANEMEPIEIGAEIFAAELIYPEQDFCADLHQMRIPLGGCTPEALVRLKRGTRTTMSYAALAKRAQFLQFAPAGSFVKIRWRTLEESMFGEPIYKRVLRYRAGRIP